MKDKSPRMERDAMEMDTEMKPNALGAPRMELLGSRGPDQPRLGATFLEPDKFSPAFDAYDDTEDGFGDEEEDELDDDEEDEFDDEDEEDEEDDEFDDEDEDDEDEEFEEEEDVAGEDEEELEEAEDED